MDTAIDQLVDYEVEIAIKHYADDLFIQLLFGEYLFIECYFDDDSEGKPIKKTENLLDLIDDMIIEVFDSSLTFHDGQLGYEHEIAKAKTNLNSIKKELELAIEKINKRINSNN